MNLLQKETIVMRTRTTARRPLAIAALGLSAGLVLAGCSDSSDDKASDASSAASSAVESASEKVSDDTKTEGALKLEDGYVTAKSTEKKMTSVMGTLKNDTDKEIHIVSVSGNVKGARYEIHQTVDGVMKVKEDGLMIPAKGEVTLKPGGDHIMIMDVPQELAAGDTVNLVLKDADGKEYPLNDIPVRVQQSSHEHYDGKDNGNGAGMSEGNHENMQHGEGHEGHEGHEGQ